MLILPRLWIMLTLSHGFSESFARKCSVLGLMNPRNLEILLCHPVLYKIIIYSLTVLAFLKIPIQKCLYHIVDCLQYGTVWALFVYLAVMCDCVFMVHGFRIFTLYCHRMLCSLACVMFRKYRRWSHGSSMYPEDTKLCGL
jgi:hypothetical protein